VDGNAHALLGQRQGNGPADAPAGTGDERAPAA
jgi:hypothetical protein